MKCKASSMLHYAVSLNIFKSHEAAKRLKMPQVSKTLLPSIFCRLTIQTAVCCGRGCRQRVASFSSFSLISSFHSRLTLTHDRTCTVNTFTFSCFLYHSCNQQHLTSKSVHSIHSILPPLPSLHMGSTRQLHWSSHPNKLPLLLFLLGGALQKHICDHSLRTAGNWMYT